MFKQFIKYFNDLEKELNPGKGKILLAVSGGIDSVVMASLFHRAGKECGIAHCNFTLRKNVSDADAEFTKKLATSLEFPFHMKRFETEQFAADNDMSVQMAARHLRYEWFNELMAEENYSAVAVAHHADDIAETMLLNLVRGTGIAGVHGIRSIHGRVIRPLLFTNRKEIMTYAQKHRVVWREDDSNALSYYHRNKIRNKVMPVLKEINPGVVEALVGHAHIMSRYERLIQVLLESEKRKLITSSHKGAIRSVSLNALSDFPNPAFLLWHLINEYGFNDDICREITSTKRPGAVFLSPGFKLIRGRDELVLFRKEDFSEDEQFTVNENSYVTRIPFGELQMESFSAKAKSGSGEKDDFGEKATAWLDASKLDFPLSVRRWKKGDTFYPLGMKGKKLLSDFIVDEKMSPVQKELVYLLLSGNEIAWVIGHRIDNRFRVTEETGHIRKFTWKEIA